MIGFSGRKDSEYIIYMTKGAADKYHSNNADPAFDEFRQTLAAKGLRAYPLATEGSLKVVFSMATAAGGKLNEADADEVLQKLRKMPSIVDAAYKKPRASAP